MQSAELKIPTRKLRQFQEILIATDGKFCSNPIIQDAVTWVRIYFEDEWQGNEYMRRWYIVNAEPVKEIVRKKSLIRRLIFWCTHWMES